VNKKIVNQLQITQVFLKKKEASLKREFFILTKNVDRKHTNYSSSNLFESPKQTVRSVKYIIISAKIRHPPGLKKPEHAYGNVNFPSGTATIPK